MMANKLDILFQHKSAGVLNIYCTAGYPQLNSTPEVINALQKNGADIIELGMPYSDPLADGEVIQHSSSIALTNGMTIAKLFEQLEGIAEKKQINVPVILMGYMNPMLQYGIEKFCAAAEKVGIAGVIIPDLPMYEFETQYRQLFEEHDLKFIFLITPETGEERIRKIDALGSGFIYAVSSSSTTGNNKPIEEQAAYFKKIKEMNLRNPVLIGFGIKDKQTFDAAAKYANGAIIGSAYIKALENSTDIDGVTAQFINKILK